MLRYKRLICVIIYPCNIELTLAKVINLVSISGGNHGLCDFKIVHKY